MADMMSILSSNYLAVGESISATSHSKYVNVDPTAYEGTWNGRWGDDKPFAVQISNVQGFRAKVKVQIGSAVSYGDVLIKDNAFRLGDSKFALSARGTAILSNVVTDPYTGTTSIRRAYAKQG